MQQRSNEGEFEEAKAATGGPPLLSSVFCLLLLRDAVGNLLLTEEVFAGFFLN